jgi:hypothetical protein
MDRVWGLSTRTLAFGATALCVLMLIAALVLADGGQPTKAAISSASPTPSASPKPKPLTRAKFIASADKICGRIDKITLPQDLQGLERRARAIAKFRKQITHGINELLALVPPKADAKYLDKHFFTALRDDKKIVTVFFTRMEKALRKGDLVELAQLHNAAYGADVAFTSIEPLQSYGFRVCVPPPVTPPPVYQPAPYVPPTYPPYDPYVYPTPEPYQPQPYVPWTPPPTPTPTPLIDLRP